MWLLFEESEEGVSLQAIREEVADLFELLGTTVDDWTPVAAFLRADESQERDIPKDLAFEYLPMAEDKALCYVAYYMRDDLPLQDIPLWFDEKILDA